MTEERPGTLNRCRTMGRLGLPVVLALLLGLGWSSDGTAQSGAEEPRLAQETPPPPPPPPPPGGEAPAVQVGEPEPWQPTYRPPARSRPTMEASAYMSVPFWADVDRDIVRPGTSLEGRFGVNLGYIVPEVEAGFSWTPIDLEKLEPGIGRDPLQSFFFGIGARLQIPNDSIITPFLSAAFDFSFWNFRETRLSCGIWYCNSRSVFRFAPGFSGRLGMAIRIGRFASIDLGARILMTFEGNFFDKTRWWVGPMLGVTFYLDG